MKTKLIKNLNKYKYLKNKQKEAFTLVELIIVMAILVVVFGIALGSVNQSQSLQIFNNNFDKIMSMIGTMRSQAITGKGQLDYVDFDNDNCNESGGDNCDGPDYVIPAHYGVYFDTANGTITTFADMNVPKSGAVGKVGKFDENGSYKTGKDLVLEMRNLPENYQLIIFDNDENAPFTKGGIFFTPNYADISFEDFTASPFLNIKLMDTKANRCRMITIHKLAGIPEVKFCN